VRAGLADGAAGGVDVGRAPAEQQAKALAELPRRAPRAASGRAAQPGNGEAGPEEASGGAIAAAARRASIGVREASAAPARVVAVPVERAGAAPGVSVVAAPAANGGEAAGVRAASAVVLRANVVADNVRAGVRRASGREPANVAGEARTAPGARRRPAPFTPSGWRSVVAESSCTATPASSW
jgi:hypothetical protein